MSVEFKFDKDAFDRVVHEHIEKVAADAGAALQGAFDLVHATYPGPDAPFDDVRSALVAALADTSMTLTEPELTSYAEKLSEGYRINVRTSVK